MPNHLHDASSPYLRQHAGNPVDWYPWGEAALDKARAEDKPIFLSIGYAACHWCHVMAHESFEDEQIAAILNRHFVSIKVDREERPDLDRIYMAAVQAMTGSGGWPMSVFLTPQGVPFYGGTYFPPQRRYGMPAFREVLLALADAWDKRRDGLLQNGQQVLAALREQNAAPSGPTQDLDPTVPEAALSRLQVQFDPRHGGWGDAPKFPQPMVLDFLLGYHAHSGDPAALDMAGQTLQAMARGGLYDQLGGGLHRYSVDAQWGTPHFEKMLYDNAQLARVYLHAWQVAGEPLYRAVVEETLDYVAREMTDPGGGFYATQDADSEGEEGKFYTWTVDEVQSVLGGDAPALMRAYDITPAGNLEGKNIPRWVGTWAERTALTAARQRLFEARRERVAPALDHKVLTSWNGLMLATLAEAARVLENARYQAMAIHNADFLLNHLTAPDGGLWHVWSDGQARIDGFLEDYACLIEGLIELYQTTFERRWYHAAAALAEAMLARFYAGDQLYDTAAGQPDLIVRPRELQDNAVPSGSAMAARVLLRLGGLGLNDRYIDLARRLIAPLQAAMARYPLGFGQWLNALDGAAAPPVSVAIAGDPGQADARALIAVCRAAYRPRVLVAAGLPDEAGVPLLRFREPLDGRATAYVCTGAVCRPPATDAAGLRALLDG